MSESSEFERVLRGYIGGAVSLSPEQISRLFQHFELMRHWNRRLNLTTVTDVKEAAVRHYGESLLVAACLAGTGCVMAVDVGSGAGFPGIPVAVACPEVRMVLLESDVRKAAFLREAADGLPAVRVIAKRSDEFDEAVVTLLSRAVKWPELLKLARRVRTIRQGIVICGEADARELGSEAGVRMISSRPVPGAAGREIAWFHVEHPAS